VKSAVMCGKGLCTFKSMRKSWHVIINGGDLVCQLYSSIASFLLLINCITPTVPPRPPTCVRIVLLAKVSES
jgi:hypothetical protein